MKPHAPCRRTADIFKPLIEQYEDLDPTPKTIVPAPVATVVSPPCAPPSRVKSSTLDENHLFVNYDESSPIVLAVLIRCPACQHPLQMSTSHASAGAQIPEPLYTIIRRCIL